MPKIIISEYDNTRAGRTPYTNFAVVVPGFVKERAKGEDGKYHYGGMVVSESAEAESVFDENDVYECTSREEFINVIGKVPATKSIVIAKKFAQPEEAPKALTQEEFNAAIARTDGKLYEAVQVTSETKPTDDKGENYDEGYVHHFVLVDERTVWDIEKRYAFIKYGNNGQDLKLGHQYGNQIAYELLGLGYTILYKKLTIAGDMNEASYWSCLKDKGVYDFRYILTGLLEDNTTANNLIISLATHTPKATETGRGDCIALVDLPADSYETSGSPMSQADAITSMTTALSQIDASQYAAIFAPYVKYAMSKEYIATWKGEDETDTLGCGCVFPASFHYLACAAKAAETYNEWYAVAGFTRGISNYTIESLGCKLGEAAVDILEPRYATANITKAINLVVKIKNSYYLWGNRTAYALGAKEGNEGDLRASHFLNIRQLCTTIKKDVYVACRRFTFDPNSDLLWVNFCNAIRPTLEKMKSDQGISDYKFVKVKSSQKALLTAKIRIVPIEAVEDFDIKLYLEDSIGGITTDIEEE